MRVTRFKDSVLTVMALGALMLTIGCGSAGEDILAYIQSNDRTTAPVLVYPDSPLSLLVDKKIKPVSPHNTGGRIQSIVNLDTLPAGLRLTPAGRIRGTPTDATPASSYRIRATGPAGSTDTSVSISVAATEDATPPPASGPSISYPGSPLTLTVDTAMTAITPTSTGGTITSYADVTGLPTGLSLNTTTGAISGTPTATSTAANYTIRATGPDGTGDAVLNITVEAVVVGGAQYSYGSIELPRVTYTTTYSAPTGGDLRWVGTGTPAGYDSYYSTSQLQAALNAASSGDVLVLEAGQTFSTSSTFTAPDHGSTDWVYVISSSLGNLTEESRVAPSDASDMPLVQATGTGTGQAAISITGKKWRFAGIEFKRTSTAVVPGLTTCYAKPGSEDVIFDRCYVHNNSSTRGAVGIGFGFDVSPGGMTRGAVVDCYITEIHDDGGDGGYAIRICPQCTGPFHVENNFLRCSGITFFLSDAYSGGQQIEVSNPVSDVTFRGNHVHRDPNWTYLSPWQMKNLWEMKCGRRILIEKNIFEEDDNYSGHKCAIQIKSTMGPTEDVTFRKNIIRTCYGGVQVWSAGATGFTSCTLDRVLIQDVLVYEWYRNPFIIGADWWYKPNAPDPTDVVLDHITVGPQNTANGSDYPTFIMFDDAGGAGTMVVDQMTLKNCLAHLGSKRGAVAFYGNDAPSSTDATAVNNHTSNRQNWGICAHVGDASMADPPLFDWEYPANTAAVGYTNTALTAVAHFDLLSTSDYYASGTYDATDGEDLGADIDALEDVETKATNGTRQ